MPSFDPVFLAIPLFVSLVLIEMVWARRHAPRAYEPRDTTVSLALGLGSTVLGALAAGTGFAMLEEPPERPAQACSIASMRGCSPLPYFFQRLTEVL